MTFARSPWPRGPIVDRFGVTHTDHGCGCRPLIHRFRCDRCGMLAGWCFGAADDWPGACDDCAARMIDAGQDDIPPVVVSATADTTG